jgi:hypothetical protein
MTEAEIQNLLYQHYEKKSFPLIVPNVNVFWGVSDLVAVSPSHIATEFEIKLTRPDFQRDKKKFRHQMLSPNPSGEAAIWHSKGWGLKDLAPGKKNKYPNHFYFVTPDELIGAGELPNYAGLMYVRDDALVTIKRAPKLHGFHLAEEQRQYLERGLVARYWKNRIERLKSSGPHRICKDCGEPYELIGEDDDSEVCQTCWGKKTKKAGVR